MHQEKARSAQGDDIALMCKSLAMASRQVSSEARERGLAQWELYVLIINPTKEV
jgi:hypothetical protein